MSGSQADRWFELLHAQQMELETGTDADFTDFHWHKVSGLDLKTFPPPSDSVREDAAECASLATGSSFNVDVARLRGDARARVERKCLAAALYAAGELVALMTEAIYADADGREREAARAFLKDYLYEPSAYGGRHKDHVFSGYMLRAAQAAAEYAVDGTPSERQRAQEEEEYRQLVHDELGSSADFFDMVDVAGDYADVC